MKNVVLSDVNVEVVRNNAWKVIADFEKVGKPIEWRAIAKEMGYRLDTFSSEELDDLKEGIEMAMIDCQDEHWEADVDFENNLKK